jgi:hypothetical protein
MKNDYEQTLDFLNSLNIEHWVEDADDANYDKKIIVIPNDYVTVLKFVYYFSKNKLVQTYIGY